MKRIFGLFLGVVLLLGLFGDVTVSASDSADYLWWDFLNVKIWHKGVSFVLDNVEVAQDAVLCVADWKTEEKILEYPFSITSRRQSFELVLEEGKSFPTGTYYVWVEDKNGAETDARRLYISEHKFQPRDVYAYPNCIKGYDPNNDIPHIYAEIAYEKYEAQRDQDGNFVINYPPQRIGTEVKLCGEDAYGCYSDVNLTVEDKKMFMPTLIVSRVGISAMFRKLQSDERLCVNVNGTMYYSEYGAGSDNESVSQLLSYSVPNDVKQVAVWLESTVGSIGESKNYTLEDCELSDCNFAVRAYPGKAVGTVHENKTKQKPTMVSTTINGQKYSAEISQDGTFALTYPTREKRDVLRLYFYDEHGCGTTISTYVDNALSTDTLHVKQVLLDKLVATDVTEGATVHVSIAGQEYVSEESTKQNDKTVTVKYPKQQVGAELIVWLQNDKTTEASKKYILKTANKKYVYEYQAQTDRIKGQVYLDPYVEENDELQSNVTAVFVIIDGTAYPCTFSKSDSQKYQFGCRYPKQKLGKTIQLRIEDADGYVITKDILLQNFKPQIKIDTVCSGDKTISGKTAARSAVTIQYGAKTYKTKAGKNGRFSVKVKSQKSGTKIKVSVVSPQGYTNSKVAKTKLGNSTVSINNDVYRTSSSISVTIREPKSGDRLTVQCAGKTYSKKFTRSRKKQKVVIRLKKKPVAGSTVSIVLRDKFGKKKHSQKVMAYYGNTISKGMSASNAVLTTWGYPVTKNDYGTGTLQWVFESGDAQLFVYIRGGKVVALQRINY